MAIKMACASGWMEVIQGDITQSGLDAIVNAANSSLLGGGGVDGAIHRAGGRSILDECIIIRSRQGGCPPGQAVITSAGKMRAEYVIHTVGPVWRGGENREAEVLASCYTESLKLAVRHGIKSLSIPNISTGIYGFPKELAAETALRSVMAFFQGNKEIELVQFVCFDPDNYELYVKEMSRRLGPDR